MRQVGAKSFKFNMERGLAALVPKADQLLDPARLTKAVEDAGFAIETMTVAATGAVSVRKVGEGQVTLLTVRERGDELLLLPPQGDAEGPARLKRLREQSRSHAATTILGRVRFTDHEKGTFGLEVLSFREEPEAPAPDDPSGEEPKEEDRQNQEPQGGGRQGEGLQGEKRPGEREDRR